MKAIAKSGNWEGIATRRETIRETSGRSGHGRARWSVFASSFGNLRSRIAASGGKGTARKVGRAREVSEGGVEIARREATDVRVNAITLHLCSKLS